MKKLNKTEQAADIIESAVSNTTDPSVIDGNEATNDYAQLVDAVVNKVKETGKVVDTSTGHSILSADQYKGTTPDIQVTPPLRNTSGFTSAATVPVVNNKPVRTANDLDLANLDETMIMDLPFISAGDFTLVDSLNLKPKNPEIRFRWVNYKNYVAGNLGRYIALGFEAASKDDVDLVKTPVHDSMIDGNTVKYYDIQLYKIHVLKLMALYKMNIVKSLGRVRNYKEAGKAAAEKDFNDTISGDPKLLAGLNKMRMANDGENPIEFYDPA